MAPHTTIAEHNANCSEAASRSVDCPPDDFDAGAYPIIAQHWYGFTPLRSIGEVAVEVVSGLKRQRQIEHVHSLGVRAVGELLLEVAEGENLDRALEAYSRLTPDLLRAVGGDHFPPLPIHEVQP